MTIVGFIAFIAVSIFIGWVQGAQPSGKEILEVLGTTLLIVVLIIAGLLSLMVNLLAFGIG